MREHVAGDFIDPENTWMKRVTELRELNDLEEMIQGSWAWSTDGTTQNAFIILQEDLSCHFTDLKRNLMEGTDDDNCYWHVNEITY